nr:MAG TPA: hypothetical protein [Caudoviricetes sp.]
MVYRSWKVNSGEMYIGEALIWKPNLHSQLNSQKE